MKRFVVLTVVIFCLAGFVHSETILPGDREVAFLLRGARAELFGNILPFWLEHSFEDRNDGFVGRINNNLTIDRYAPKNLSMTARLLWFFSATHRVKPDEDCLDAAERAYEYLEEYFFDEDEEGYFWQLEPTGRPRSRKKVLYGHAFMVYGLSEYYLASGEEDALERAKKVFDLIESKFRDEESGHGYLEVLNQEWEQSGKATLSQSVPVGGKTMNAHLHMVEAYANLYRAWPDPRVKTALTGLIRLFIDKMLNSEELCFYQTFDEDWDTLGESFSFGHDLEAVWLLCDAAETLDDQAMIQEVYAMSLKVTDVVLMLGVDEDGGLFYEGADGVVTKDGKYWWPQAEAVTGFLQAWQITQELRYLSAASGVWRFIEERIVDSENGEWFKSVQDSGSPSAEKVSEWKGPYHNGRACMELIRRLQ